MQLAFMCDNFRLRWLEKVSTNEGVYKALTYWVA